MVSLLAKEAGLTTRDDEGVRCLLPVVPLFETLDEEIEIRDEEMAMVYSFNTARANFAIDCNKHAIKTNREWLGDPGLPLPDPVTMAIAAAGAAMVSMVEHVDGASTPAAGVPV